MIIGEIRGPFIEEMHHLIIKIMGWLNMHDNVMTIVLIVYVLFY